MNNENELNELNELNPPVMDGYTKIPTFKLWVANRFPYMETDFDALTNYEILTALVDYLNNVIKNEETVESNVSKLNQAYLELFNYVKDYFNNLDVQEEINNKLDNMVESGQLQEIISNYLNSKAIFAFDTINDMKNATNLINGSYAKTLGFYSKNDGGMSTYKIRNITNDDVVDNMFIIAMNNQNLVAELIIDNELNIKQIGAKENEPTFDNAQILYNSLKYIQSKNGGVISIPSGIFYINNQINIDFDVYSTCLIGNKGVPTQNKGSILKYTNNGFMINFNGRCNNCEFRDFMILNENNSGMSFNLTSHKTQLINITIKDALKGLLFNTGTYTRINNLTYTSSNENSEYGIQIGSEDTHYTTEFFYITNCSINFDNIAEGICINILKTEGGIWCEHNDLCNTNGKAIQIDNQRGNSSNYYNFDNNNISGCKYGFYIKASTGNIGGIYINNQRISLNGNSIDERFLYTERLSSYNIEIHMSNMYLRSRNSSVLPTYIYEITQGSCNPDTEISYDGGEKFNTPIYCNSNIKKINDFRIDYGKQLNINYFTTTGDKEVKLSNYKCLIKGSNFTKWQSGNVNSIENIYFIRLTYDSDGYPIANLRISTIPNSRINIITTKEFYALENAPL